MVPTHWNTLYSACLLYTSELLLFSFITITSSRLGSFGTIYSSPKPAIATIVYRVGGNFLSLIHISREYSGKDKSTEIICGSEPGGIWSAKPFYIFPGSGSQTVFSITLEDNLSLIHISYAYMNIADQLLVNLLTNWNVHSLNILMM